MMDEQFIRNRLTKLRQQKQVSERKMSLDLGHSTSYIRSITSGRALPSMSEFLYICEYLGTTPMEFFNEEHETSLIEQEAIGYIHTMSEQDIRAMIEFIKQLKNAEKRRYLERDTACSYFLRSWFLRFISSRTFFCASESARGGAIFTHFFGISKVRPPCRLSSVRLAWAGWD